MTVPPRRSAKSIASADLPLHVGPATISAMGKAMGTLADTPVPCHAPAMEHILTLIAPQGTGTLTPALIARVREAVQGGPAAVLSEGEAADIPCPAVPDPDAIHAALDAAPVDAVLTPAANRRKRLLVADMDSTIVTTETLDELAAYAGLGEEVAAITRRSMNGEIDFAGALRHRVGLLRGLPLAALEQTWAATHLMPGARELVATMRAHGATTALVSGGFTYFTGRVAALLGTVGEPILDRDAKLAALHELAAAGGLTPSDALAVGDGANDLAMIRAAGLGVAYHAKPIVAAEASVRIEHAGLRALLFMQGYPASSFVGM